MYRKKLMQACLAGALVATIGTSANVPVVKAAAETQTVSETDDAEDVEESEEVEDTEEEEAVEETSEDEEVETEEVETYSAGDAGEENSPEENKSVIVKYQFVCDGKFVAGGDCFVPSGIQNYSVFEEYLPEGYTRVTGGDTTITEGETYVIRVEKIDSGDTEEPEKTEVTMNIQFKDGDEVVGGGDYTVPAGVQNYSVLEQYAPAGYKITESGDFFAEDGAKLKVNKKPNPPAMLGRME